MFCNDFSCMVMVFIALFLFIVCTLCLLGQTEHFHQGSDYV